MDFHYRAEPDKKVLLHFYFDQWKFSSWLRPQIKIHIRRYEQFEHPLFSSNSEYHESITLLLANDRLVSHVQYYNQRYEVV